MKKFDAQTILDALNCEMNQDEVNEIYKALIAYSMNMDSIDDNKLNKVIDYYFENDWIPSIINEDIREYTESLFEDENE